MIQTSLLLRVLAYKLTVMTSVLPKLIHLNKSTFSQVRFVLTDIDDTLTWQSKLPCETFEALYALSAAGYVVIPVTGGCAGWSDLIARMWPVAGVITEGGACFIQKQTTGQLQYSYWDDAKIMQQNKAALLAQVLPLLTKYSSLQLAQDQVYRLTDVAVDYSQDVFPPAIKEKQALLTELKNLGLQAKASSIHINIWAGNYDKYTMAKRVLTKEYGLTLEQLATQVVYIGDAPNDESMFAKFPLSIGVANIAQHLDVMEYKPCCITEQAGGYGFTEVANYLLTMAKP